MGATPSWRGVGCFGVKGPFPRGRWMGFRKPKEVSARTSRFPGRGKGGHLNVGSDDRFRDVNSGSGRGRGGRAGGGPAQTRRLTSSCVVD